MLSFLFFLGSSKEYYFVNDTLTSLILANNDRVVINATGIDRYAFIHISPHFFFGELKLNATHIDDVLVVNPNPSERLLFVDSIITIDYKNAPAFCKIDIFLTDKDVCDERTLHVRGIRSAEIFSNDFEVENHLCYWFDFSVNTSGTYNIDSASSSNVTMIYPDSNGKLRYVDLSQNEMKALPALFVVRLDIGNFNRSKLSFTNGKSFGDWTDIDKNFTCWPAYSCITPYEDYRIRTIRSVAWFIWTILILGLIVPFAIIVFCMFSKPSEIVLSSVTTTPSEQQANQPQQLA